MALLHVPHPPHTPQPPPHPLDRAVQRKHDPAGMTYVASKGKESKPSYMKEKEDKPTGFPHKGTAGS